MALSLAAEASAEALVPPAADAIAAYDYLAENDYCLYGVDKSSFDGD